MTHLESILRRAGPHPIGPVDSPPPWRKELTSDALGRVRFQLSPDPDAAFVVVFTRDDAASTKFLQTDRFDF